MNLAPVATEIELKRKDRIFAIKFEDGAQFDLSYELLRVHSPSAEVQGHKPSEAVLQVGKKDVEISKVNPVGNYALKITFDDGHDTGLYSWEWLYELGVNHAELWETYLEKLEAAGESR